MRFVRHLVKRTRQRSSKAAAGMLPWPECERLARPLTPEESGVLAALLSRDFPGVEALRLQAKNVLGHASCVCGCGTIGLHPLGTDLPLSTTRSPVPVEGSVRDA